MSWTMKRMKWKTKWCCKGRMSNIQANMSGMRMVELRSHLLLGSNSRILVVINMMPIQTKDQTGYMG